MSKEKTKEGWGAWIRSRMKIVGLASQKELAEAANVGVTNLSRWLQNADPPAGLKLESADKLARALQTHVEVILHEWEGTDPWDAPSRTQWEVTRGTERGEAQFVERIMADVESMQSVTPEVDASKLRDERRREEIMAFVGILDSDALARIHAYVLDEMRQWLGESKRTPRKTG